MPLDSSIVENALDPWKTIQTQPPRHSRPGTFPHALEFLLPGCARSDTGVRCNESGELQ